MNNRFGRLLLVAGAAASLAGCGNRETKEALQKATALEDQKQYQEANSVLVAALQAREAQLRPDPRPTDPAEAKALLDKIGADSEILKMERAQIPIYLHLERPDLASAVYSDILSGHPGDTVVYDSLRDKDPLVRTGAVRVLGLAGKPDAISSLASALKDDDKDVRRSAVAALGMIRDPAAIDPLISALKDSYWFVRSEAAEALGQQLDPRAVDPLIAAVADENSIVESSSEGALLQLCDRSKTKLSPETFAARLTDPNPKIVMISAFCLAVLKDPRSVPVLLKFSQSSDLTTRLQALKGLGETGDPSAIPTLRTTLKETDVDVRGWSIIGLGNLKDQASLATLQAIAADGSQPPKIKAAAQAAVNHITGQDAAPNGQ